MTTFADSSALVKLYADEAGHEAIRETPDLVVSVLARVEVPAAIWHKQRTGELSAEDARILTAEFEADYLGTDDTAGRFAVVGIAPQILDTAARGCATHGLRGYDAVQLATALAVRAVVPSCHNLAAFDASLRRAAAAEGFRLLPAQVR